jgi:cytoskeletal protein RodZ
MNDDMTNVIMSSADWQRNEQRHLRREKRLIAIIILVIVLFVGSNTFWIWRDSQYEDVVTTEETIIEGVTQETEGGDNNFVGGDYTNGETNN